MIPSAENHPEEFKNPEFLAAVDKVKSLGYEIETSDLQMDDLVIRKKEKHFKNDKEHCTEKFIRWAHENPNIGEESVTLEEYTQDVLRTKADVKDPQERIDHEVEHLFFTIINVCELADRLKRKVFYGKVKEVDQRIKFENIIRFMRTAKRNDAVCDLFHGILGALSEIPEIVAAVAYGYNPQRVAEEVGDFNWYNAIITRFPKHTVQQHNRLSGSHESLKGLYPSEILVKNIEKLKKRYPEKFTEKEAIERNDENEEDNSSPGKVD